MKKFNSFLILFFGVYMASAQKPVANFAMSKDTICEVDCIDFYDLSTNNPTSRQWYFQGTIDSLRTDTNPQCVFYTYTGTFSIKLVVSNSYGSDSVTKIITVHPIPSAPWIIQQGDTLVCHPDSSVVSYQWYDTSTAIAGATDSFLVIDHCSNYNVLVKTKYGCGVAVGINHGICGLPNASFRASKDSLCINECISFKDLGICCINSWQWTFEGAYPATSTLENPQGICYLLEGTFNVKLVISDQFSSDSITQVVYVSSLPPTPNITRQNDTLFCSYDSSYVSYQWYDSSGMIPGATLPYYVIDSCGVYTVAVTDANGCQVALGISGGLNTDCPEGIEDYAKHNVIFLSPNPATDRLTIQTSSFHPGEVVTVSVMNVLGEIIQEERIKWSNATNINVRNIRAGIYFIQLKTGKANVAGRFVKE